MEFVALSDTVLRTLALEDPTLRRVFHGVYPADQLPRSPPRSVRQAYIVNTDPAGEPGQHWLGLWTEQNKCEVFDSYGLPLHVYTNPELHQWWGQWKYLTHSDMTLHAMDLWPLCFIFLEIFQIFQISRPYAKKVSSRVTEPPSFDPMVWSDARRSVGLG